MVSDHTISLLFLLAHVIVGMGFLVAMALLLFLARRPAAEKVLLEQVKTEKKAVQTQDLAAAARREVGSLEP
jgi:hypothetical protein